MVQAQPVHPVAEQSEVPFARASRRIGAFVIDLVLLAGIGALAGLASRFFRLLGPWGPVVGAVVAVGYFTIGNSSVTGGRTLGKRVLGLKVVGAVGECISIGRSFVRALVLLAPAFFADLAYPPRLMGQLAFSIPLTVVTVGGFLCVAYLFVRNLPSRRSLHELAAHTAVLQSDGGSWQPERLARVHRIACGAALLAGPLLLVAAQLSFGDTWASLIVVAEDARSVPSVWSARGSIWWHSSSNGEESVGLVMYARSTGDPDDYPELSAELAQRVLEGWPSEQHIDDLTIVVDYGFDLFLFNFARTKRMNKSPEGWRQELISLVIPQNLVRCEM